MAKPVRRQSPMEITLPEGPRAPTSRLIGGEGFTSKVPRGGVPPWLQGAGEGGPEMLGPGAPGEEPTAGGEFDLEGMGAGSPMGPPGGEMPMPDVAGAGIPPGMEQFAPLAMRLGMSVIMQILEFGKTMGGPAGGLGLQMQPGGGVGLPLQR